MPVLIQSLSFAIQLGVILFGLIMLYSISKDMTEMKNLVTEIRNSVKKEPQFPGSN